ncbi:MAG: DUF6088 family protein [Pseudomonadota bacterium]
MKSLKDKMLSRIYGKGHGWVFTPKSFADLGGMDSVRMALTRLAKKGTIRRLTTGLYDYPEKHKTLGILPPKFELIAKAIADSENLVVQPSGAYAANLLGLSEQVPAKIVFLTDGLNKKLKIGRQEIIFTKTTPKNMASAGKISGLIIQALRYIGCAYVNENHIRKMKRDLSDKEKKILKRDSRFAPDWVKKIIERITS